MIYRFYDHELDEEAYELRHQAGQGRVEVEPRVFDLIAYLVKHRGRVVSKGEILREVWSGAVVSESVLPHCIAAARKALGDDAKLQKVIQTAHGRGYRFVATVIEASPEDAVLDGDGGLEALSGPCRRLLEVASVLGAEFSAAVLQRMLDQSPGALLETLDELVNAGVLQAVEEALSRYRFLSHDLGGSLYENLGLAERTRLHGQAARFIQEQEGLEGALDEVARHAYLGARGGEAEDAILLCSFAGERAAQTGSYAESALWCERALEAFSLDVAPDPNRRFELVVALGRARQAAGQRAAGRRCLESAADLARQLGQADLLAEVACELRPVHELGLPAEETTCRILDEALAGIGSGQAALRARLLARRVDWSLDAGPTTVALAMSDEAITLSRASPASESLRDALAARLGTCMGPDRIDERLELSEELLALATRGEDRLSAMLGHEGAFVAHLLRGDAPSVERSLSAFSRLAEALRLPYPLFQSAVMLGSWALARGDFDDADRRFEEALAKGRRLPIDRVHFIHAGLKFMLGRRREEAEPSQFDRVMFGEMMELPYTWQPAARCALAVALAARGDREGARRELAAIDELGVDRLPHDEHWLATLDALSEIAVLLQDRRRAATLFALLEPYEDLFVVHDVLRTVGSSVGSVLGALAALLGRPENGLSHLVRAIERERSMGLGPALWESQAVYACVLARRGGPGDEERAEALRSAVRAQRERCGLSGLPRRAVSLDSALQSRRGNVEGAPADQASTFPSENE